MPAALAFRYARALADLAGTAQVDDVAAELDRFAAALKESADLSTAMESPAVSPVRKRAVVTQLAKILPLSDLVRRFLFVVIDHRRSALISEIREAYQQVMDDRLGVVRAHIGSARSLGGAEREQVLASLARLTGKEVRANFEVREELIGGVLARIGSTVYDGSVKGQLETLKQRLAGAEK